VARHALLIGVSEFTDQRLARLNAPTNDVIALRGILQDSSRGSFDSVELSVNEDILTVRDHLSRFFYDRTPDDVLLLYYSGHGILGRGNRLFLATSGSNLDTPRTRCISAREIRDFIEESRAQRQVVVLDCCHSGAFGDHTKGAASAPAVTAETFSAGDAGLYVLTAADALQFAWDGTSCGPGMTMPVASPNSHRGWSKACKMARLRRMMSRSQWTRSTDTFLGERVPKGSPPLRSALSKVA
jgi:uncharacterized caspase-like protein